MAEFIKNKYVDSEGVKHLWEKADDKFVSKDGDKVLSDNNYTDAEVAKLEGIEANANNYSLPNAAADTLGGVKIGAGLSIDAEGVVSTVYNPEMPVDWEDIQETPTTLEGYGITDAASDDELAALASTVSSDIANLSASVSSDIANLASSVSSDMEELEDKLEDRIDDVYEELKEEVSKVYKYCGKVATAADLDNIVNPKNGDVYDVEEDGTNYAWNADEERWDNIGAIIRLDSLSNYELDIITGSASSTEALKNLLVEGGDVSLSDDVALDMTVEVKNNTVLDLGGHTLNVNVGSGYALVADGAILTIKGGNIASNKRLAQAENGGQVVIKGGTFTAGDVGFSALGAGSKVTIDGGNVTAVEGGVGAFDGGSIEVNGGTISGTDNFPLFTNGTAGRGGNTIVFNDGELIGNIQSNGYEACGVYIANNDTFIMNGGSIVANGGCGILMRAGNVTINGGSVTALMGEHVPGWVGDKKKVMSASAVIYDEESNYPGKAGMSLVINGGTFVGADHSVEILSNEATPNVTINGGEFTPAV